MTVRQLQAEIRKSVLAITEAYQAFNDSDYLQSDKLAIEKLVNKYQSHYGKGRKGVFALNFKKMRKAELESTLNVFNNFSRYIKTETNRAQRNFETFHKQYKSFNKRYGNGGDSVPNERMGDGQTQAEISEDTYRGLIEVFSALGSRLLEQMGSDQIIEFYERWRGKRTPQEIAQALISAYEDGIGKGGTAETIMDTAERLIGD